MPYICNRKINKNKTKINYKNKKFCERDYCQITKQTYLFSLMYIISKFEIKIRLYQILISIK